MINHPLRILVLLAAFFALQLHAAESESINLTLSDDSDIQIESLSGAHPADYLAIWLVEHDQERPVFDAMLESQADHGIDIWRIDLPGELFLDRNNETIRTLSGDAVRDLIQLAHTHSELPIVLVSYDRLTLPLLRGVHAYQSSPAPNNRLIGSLLFYPNVFGPAPQAGVDAMIDPIVSASNYPLMVIQPEFGSHRWRMSEVMQQFWQTGSAASLVKLAGVRDWFFMGPPAQQEQFPDAARDKAVADMPKLSRRLMKHLLQQNRPAKAIDLPSETPSASLTDGPQALETAPMAPPLSLPELQGDHYTLEEIPEKVILLSFWATWCPPCVEEMPSMNALAADYSAEDFEIISVNFQQSKDEIQAFLKKVDVDFPILLDQDGRTAKSWKVFSFPSSFILDRSGRVRYTLNKAIDWHTPDIKNLLDNLVEER